MIPVQVTYIVLRVIFSFNCYLVSLQNLYFLFSPYASKSLVRVRWRGKGRATQAASATAPVSQSTFLVHLMYCTILLILNHFDGRHGDAVLIKSNLLLSKVKSNLLSMDVSTLLHNTIIILLARVYFACIVDTLLKKRRQMAGQENKDDTADIFYFILFYLLFLC